jgi:hypothetical protein
MNTPTTSITAKVSRYWMSFTMNEKRGGTKKKSNAATFISAPTIAGPRPHFTARSTTVSMNSIAIVASSKLG